MYKNYFKRGFPMRNLIFFNLNITSKLLHKNNYIKNITEFTVHATQIN